MFPVATSQTGSPGVNKLFGVECVRCRRGRPSVDWAPGLPPVLEQSGLASHYTQHSALGRTQHLPFAALTVNLRQITLRRQEIRIALLLRTPLFSLCSAGCFSQ